MGRTASITDHELSILCDLLLARAMRVLALESDGATDLIPRAPFQRVRVSGFVRIAQRFALPRCGAEPPAHDSSLYYTGGQAPRVRVPHDAPTARNADSLERVQ
jgi:hypothetical protein